MHYYTAQGVLVVGFDCKIKKEAIKELCTQTGCGGRIGREQASFAESRKFDSRSSQTNDLPNLYLSLPNLALDINRIGQRLVNSVLG